MIRGLFSTLALAVLVAGCSGAGPTPSPAVHLTGTFGLLRGSNGSAVWAGGPAQGECVGTGGYSDFRGGMSVVVKDQAGSIIATSSTAMGHPTTDGAGTCLMAFDVAPIPDAPFYSIEIGHRGAITYSKADLVAKAWHLDLTLGG